MKKLLLPRLLSFALMIALSVWLDSCKKEDDPGAQPTPTTVEGNYKITALKASPKLLGQFEDLLGVAPLVLGTSCLSDLTVTFKTGGDVTTDNPASCQKSAVPASMITGIDASSKWVLNGTKLTVTKSDASKTEYAVLSTGATLQVQWQGQADYENKGTKTTYTYTMDLKKQ
ncbi:lipocalin family protein [Spirosoma areae]